MTDSVIAVPVVNNHGPGVGQILIDANNLVTLYQAGQLDLLLRTNREIVVTGQIQDEVVARALAHSNPAVQLEGAAIGAWLDQHVGIHGIRIYTPSADEIPPGPGDLGERSMVAAADYFTQAGNDVIIMSDDFRYFGYGVRGLVDPRTAEPPVGSMANPLSGAQITDYPVLSTISFLNSLLIDGGISPLDYAYSAGAIHQTGRINMLAGIESVMGPGNYIIRIGDGIPIATYSWDAHGSEWTLVSGGTVSGGLTDRTGPSPDGTIMINPPLVNHSILPQSFDGEFVQLHNLVFIIPAASSPYDSPVVFDSDGNLALGNLSDSISGLAAITSVLDGTPLETFLPSAFWPSGGIDWDWSSVSMQPVNFAVPFATQGNSYTPLPGIVVSGNGGQFIGSFAQTNDGRPAISVTDTITGDTHTYMETAPGIAGVVIDTGSYTGTFAVAPGSNAGSLGAFLDPNAGLGQFGSFDIRDNATGEVVQDGIIVGGDGVDVLSDGGAGNDTIVVRDLDAATGEWQTTVLTAEQAATNQINQNLANYELAGGEIGQIFGSSLGQALAGDNVFAQVASSTVLGTFLPNLGETWGRSATTGESLLDAAIGENGAFNDFDQELGQNFQQQALGAVSGFLLGELAESLGFDGSEFGDQLFRASAGSLASTVLNNALAISQGSTTVDLFTGIDGNLATGIGSFVGGYIAREIVAPETLRLHAANDEAPWTDVRGVA